MTLGRAAGRPRFSVAERDQLATFATQASVALELRRARAEREEVRTLEDHDRIAADLHERVIHQLFSLGLGLMAMVDRVPGSVEKERLTE